VGLYDSVKVRLPLPDEEAQGLTFQTKDLGCDLEMYVIDEEGNLLRADGRARGFSFYAITRGTTDNARDGMWYEYYAHLNATGNVDRIERVYVGPASQRHDHPPYKQEGV
jgi:hypothetical protein